MSEQATSKSETSVAGQRPKALVLMSSNKVLPLAEPAGHPGVSTGVFFIELGQILQEFGPDYDFTFATTDGQLPQVDINGFALQWQAVEELTSAMLATTAEEALGFDADKFRARRPELIARRDSELDLAYRYLGNVPVSEVLPRTDKEVAPLRDEIAARFASLPSKTYFSAQQLVERDRDPEDAFDLGDYDFAHIPGGHAPMVDYVDNPWLGELINVLHEKGVLVSLICHAPVAMVSAAKYRVDKDGNPVPNTANPFKGITVTTVPKYAEILACQTAFLKLPGHKTRPTYYVDEALEEAGFTFEGVFPNAGAPKLIWEPSVRILTGNGPQAVDQQAAMLRTLLTGRGN
ncbi:MULTISPECIES: hypothetical protein [unclassified Mycobacterium]|uniref:hypothetical protein n=1 Tax=unclassified Mycobacterium TaxID=2642494 RepID=UPI0009920F6B|nr:MULTISPECIES: hypothetical protein [unclassified Mycobacterium]